MHKRICSAAVCLVLLFSACTPAATTSPAPATSTSLPHTQTQPVDIPDYVPPVYTPIEGYHLAFTGAWDYTDRLMAVLYSEAETLFVHGSTLYRYRNGDIETVMADVHGIAGQADGLFYLIARDTAHTPQFSDNPLVRERASSLIAYNPATGTRTVLAQGAQQAILHGGHLLYTRVVPNEISADYTYRLAIETIPLAGGAATGVLEDKGLDTTGAGSGFAFAATLSWSGGLPAAKLHYPWGSEYPYERILVFGEDFSLVADSEEQPVSFEGDGFTWYKNGVEIPEEELVGDGFIARISYDDGTRYAIDLLARDGSEAQISGNVYFRPVMGKGGVLYYTSRYQPWALSSDAQLPLRPGDCWTSLIQAPTQGYLLALYSPGQAYEDMPESDHYTLQLIRLDGDATDPAATTLVAQLAFGEGAGVGERIYGPAPIVTNTLLFVDTESPDGELGLLVYNTLTGEYACLGMSYETPA